MSQPEGNSVTTLRVRRVAAIVSQHGGRARPIPAQLVVRIVTRYLT